MENDKVSKIQQFIKFIEFGKMIKYFDCSSNLKKKIKNKFVNQIIE